MAKPCPATRVAANSIAKWVGKPSQHRPADPRGFFGDAIAQLEPMLDSGDWDGARPKHLVALYGWCHREVYGIDAAELSVQSIWLSAVRLASQLVEREFGGDLVEAVQFIRWTWQREESREQWRKENRRPTHRLAWRFQFSPTLLTDYRIARARRIYP